MLTDQEIFDKVARHLLTQKQKSVDYTGCCAYRGNNGTKCAVGCLISDEDYLPELEGMSMSMLEEGDYSSGYQPRADVIYRITDNIKLLDALQGVHDSYGVHMWQHELGIVADNFNLSRNVLNEF